MNNTEEKQVPKETRKLIDLHAAAVREFDSIQEALSDEREQCLEDRRFVTIAGAQWEGTLKSQFKNKPQLEVNKIALAVTRIINEYRNNRITVNFVSKDGSSPEIADTVQSLFRADEQDSTAEEAYDNAFNEAVKGGIGAIRLRAEYEDEEDDEDEYQRIRIEPIYDADKSVFFDLNAKRQDKADANSCYVLSSMTRDYFEEKYPEQEATSVHVAVDQTEFDWTPGDIVHVAEYYKVEHVKETVRIFKNLDESEEKYFESDFLDDPELEERLLDTGNKEVRKKTIKRRRVHKYVISGARILEDCGYIAGKCIPIIPVYGHREFIDNIERCRGHVRFPKDTQRLKNMQLSKLAEITSLSSVEKPIFFPEQMAGHQDMWADDNLKNYPNLLINPIMDEAGNILLSGPVAYTKPPSIPPAMAALLQLTETDMSDMLGNQEKGDKIVSNISGKAVQLVQDRLDYQAYIYMSNLAKGIRRVGEVWVSMARDLYVEEGRKMKTIGERDEVGTVQLMKPTIESQGGFTYENNMSSANLDVTVDVGPSSQSKRAATVQGITDMLAITSDPETQQVLQSMAIMNMEGEGIQDVREFFRKKLVKMGALKPTEKEVKEMASAAKEPDPNAQYLQAAAEESMAKASKARADNILTMAKAEETKAKTEETKAKTLETLSEIGKV